LVADLPRKVLGRGSTVNDAIDELDGRWPGLRDRLCEEGPALRRHIHVYVDRERAALDTPIEDRSHVNVVAAISGG
jgi:sulfur-carrier protein